jgi:FixJ family two-component response regulator
MGAASIEPKQLIVVVEDDEGIRRAIDRLLKVEGFDTALFDSAEALLAAGMASDARCLVPDAQLPGLSGFDLQKHLVAAGMASPVIFITAHDTPRIRKRALANASAYLVKPFSSAALVDAVTRARMD